LTHENLDVANISLAQYDEARRLASEIAKMAKDIEHQIYEQKKKLEAAATANREAMRQAFQGGNRDQNQDREQMRAKFQELRKTADEKCWLLTVTRRPL
jgi:hypothetical protein